MGDKTVALRVRLAHALAGCGVHELPFLRQTYRRDPGAIMHDVSAPIRVDGRHWGGFRIGYRTE